MYKYFTYVFDTKKFTDYKLLIQKNNFASFKKIEYDNFKIIYSNDDMIHFQIDMQLIRKLKILKLNDEIKINSREANLSLLLESSKEVAEKGYVSESLTYWYSAGNYDNEIVLVKDKEENKFRLKHDSQKYNQRIKQYENKRRFRK